MPMLRVLGPHLEEPLTLEDTLNIRPHSLACLEEGEGRASVWLPPGPHCLPLTDAPQAHAASIPMCASVQQPKQDSPGCASQGTLGISWNRDGVVRMALVSSPLLTVPLQKVHLDPPLASWKSGCASVAWHTDDSH